MNIYIVVEGSKTEKEVYKHWVPYINPDLTYVDYISDIGANNFYIVAGYGYPSYFRVIEDAISDVNTNTQFDRLVISVDSENMTYADKHDELSKFISKFSIRVDCRIIIQHFCFEAWALGNKKVVRRHPASSRLISYKRIFDVRLNDPELLPDHVALGMNRSQFAESYLRIAINDKNRHMSYSKSNPKFLLPKTYFDQLVRRYNRDGHIASFNDFLCSFV